MLFESHIIICNFIEVYAFFFGILKEGSGGAYISSTMSSVVFEL